MITGLSALAAVTGGLRPEPPEPTGFSWGRVVEAITTFVERPAGAAPALELTVDLGAGAPGRLAVTAVGPGRITLQWIGWRGAATWLHARLPALVAALARRRIRVHEISHDDDR